jgi:hypothetical protein
MILGRSAFRNILWFVVERYAVLDWVVSRHLGVCQSLLSWALAICAFEEQNFITGVDFGLKSCAQHLKKFLYAIT